MAGEGPAENPTAGEMGPEAKQPFREPPVSDLSELVNP